MTDEPEFTPGPDLVAKLDQLGATMGTIAQLLASYFHDLTAQGFERDEALALVRDWQQQLLGLEIALAMAEQGDDEHD